MMIIVDNKNEIMMDEIYVVLSLDENGEGIVSMITPMGGMPLVFGHPRMMDDVKETMKKISQESGRTLRMFKFVKSELIAEVNMEK